MFLETFEYYKKKKKGEALKQLINEDIESTFLLIDHFLLLSTPFTPFISDSLALCSIHAVSTIGSNPRIETFHIKPTLPHIKTERIATQTITLGIFNQRATNGKRKNGKKKKKDASAARRAKCKFGPISSVQLAAREIS